MVRVKQASKRQRSEAKMAVSEKPQSVSTKIVVNDVELTVTQTENSVNIKRVVAKDRIRKLDITSGVTFSLNSCIDPPGIELVHQLKKVANYQTAKCTCGYSYGWSDHAEHCQSIYVAEEYIDHDD